MLNAKILKNFDVNALIAPYTSDNNSQQSKWIYQSQRQRGKNLG